MQKILILFSKMKKEDFIFVEGDIADLEKFLFSLLNESLRRKYAGLLAIKSGYNGVSYASQYLGIHKHTVRSGKKELIARTVPPDGKIRKKGGGRKKKL